MRRSLAVLLMLMLMTSSWAFKSVAAANRPQNVFDVDVILQIEPAKVGNGTSWIGKFRLEVTLKDPEYVESLNEIAKNNSEAAKQVFFMVINNTVYASLRYNIIQRYAERGLKPAFIVPEDGPIKLGENWSATVDLGVTDALVLEGHYLVSPLSGNLTLWMANQSYEFNWRSFVLIIPEGYEVEELNPKPAEVHQNVMVWKNGSYIPEIVLYSPGYSFVKFLNETEGERELKVHYTASDGRAYFEAVFPEKPSSPVRDAMLYVFKEAMDPINIDFIDQGGSFKVVGVFHPPAVEKESFLWIQREAYITLPFPFSRVEVEGADYELKGSTLVLRTKEVRVKNLLLIIGAAGALIVGVGASRRRGKKPPEEPAGGSGEEMDGSEGEEESGGE